MRITIRIVATVIILWLLSLSIVLVHYCWFRWSIPPLKSLETMDSDSQLWLLLTIELHVNWAAIAVIGRRFVVFSLLALLASMALLAFPTHFYLLVNYPWYKLLVNINLVQFTLINDQIHYVGAGLGLLVLIAVGYVRLLPSRDLE